MYLHCKWHFWLTSATLHKLRHFFAFLLYLVRVDLGYDMTWVQLDRGYEITWVRVDLVRVDCKPFEVSSRGWLVTGIVFMTSQLPASVWVSVLSVISSSQALLRSSRVHCLLRSHRCGADPVSLYCIWRWPRLFIWMTLTDASTAGDDTDFHTQGDQAQLRWPPVRRISCQQSSFLVSSHDIQNPVHCRCHGHFRETQSADCLI